MATTPMTANATLRSHRGSEMSTSHERVGRLYRGERQRRPMGGSVSRRSRPVAVGLCAPCQPKRLIPRDRSPLGYNFAMLIARLLLRSRGEA